MGPIPHLRFCAFKTETLGPELQVSMGPRPHQWFCVCKTACLASETLVSMGPSPHLWFLQAKQRVWDPKYKSQWVPDLICGICMQNRDFRTRIASLYGSQTSPMILCMKNSVLSVRITSLYGCQPSYVVFAWKRRLLDQNYNSLWVPHLTCCFVHVKQSDYNQKY